MDAMKVIEEEGDHLARLIQADVLRVSDLQRTFRRIREAVTAAAVGAGESSPEKSADTSIIRELLFDSQPSARP